MPCRIAVDGDLATLRLRLVDPTEAPLDTGGSAAEPDIFTDLWRDHEGLEKDLGGKLTDEARRLLASDEVDVEVELHEGSLLVSALIVGKVVGEIGAFFAGLREIRNVFPERIRGHIVGKLGRDLAMRDEVLEIERGLLRAEDADTKDKDAEDKDAKGKLSLTEPPGLVELAVYAVLSLLVLSIVALLVFKGVSELT